jgi:hypothetical protein
MTPMEPVTVVGPDGPVSLQDVFEGRPMLMVYHFMWNPGAPHEKQCEGCTHSQAAMNPAVRAYLAERDVNYAVFSSGPMGRDRCISGLHGLDDTVVLDGGFRRCDGDPGRG